MVVVESGPLENLIQLMPVLEQFSLDIGEAVSVTNPHGRRMMGSANVTVAFWANSASVVGSVGDTQEYRSVFGISVPVGARDGCPGGEGEPVMDVWVCVASVYENYVFIHFDLPHCSFVGADDILTEILKQARSLRKPLPSAVVRLQREFASARIRQLEEERRQREICVREAEVFRAKASRHKKAVAILETDRPWDITEVLRQVHALAGVYTVKLTRQEITVTSDGVFIEHENVKYSLGRITFTLSERGLWFIQKKTHGPLCHPHVGKCGEPCLPKEMKSVLHAMILTGRIVEAVCFTLEFLHTYTLGDAHSGIENWRRKKEGTDETDTE